jgi:putative ABC transport system permease protein
MRRFVLRFLNAFRRGTAETDLDREVAAHLAILEDDCRRRGMSAGEARLAAKRALGSVAHTKDLHRDARSFPWLNDLWTDIRYGWRTLARNPGFTSVALITLALGIGANTAIFSVIQAVLLNPLPFRSADRLVRLVEHVPAAASPTGRPLVQGGINLEELIELRTRSRPLSHMVTYGTDIVTLVGAASDGSLAGTAVSAGTFPMLGVQPILGRTFLPEEEAADGPKAVVLSHRAWQRLFGGDPGILGRVVTFTGTTTSIGGSIARGAGYAIVGVMPSAFHFPDDNTQFWTARPLVRPPDGRPRRAGVMARLADGVTREAALAELSSLLHEMRGDGQQPRDRWSKFELTFVQDHVTAPLKSPLLVLAGAVGFVLLIACANVANLLLARTAARRREIAVRVALGAGRGRLLRQILTETVLLGLLGGAAATVLAFGGVRAFRALAATMPRLDLGATATFPRLDAIGIDATVLAFTIGLSLVAGLVFGLAPAMSFAWTEQIDGLRQGMAAGRSRFGSDRAVQGVLVVGEIAIAMLLLVGGGLLMHSFLKLASVNPGYDPSNVLTFQVAVRGDLYSAASVKGYADDLVTRLQSVPGVQGAAYARQLPTVQLQESYPLTTAPQPPGTPPNADSPDARFVSRDYLEVMGVRMIAGRGFAAAAGTTGPAEVVVSQALARRDFPGTDPVGRLVYIGRQTRPFQIVGVADDVRQFGLDRDPTPQFFADVSQWPGRGNQFPVGPYYAVRIDGRPAAAVMSDVAGAARQLDPQATLSNVATMEGIVGNSMVRPRLYAVLLAIFAAVAVVLAAIGIFGVMAYTVAQRTREIGIRMALGARRAQVLRLVLGRSLSLTVIGIALGLTGAGALTRYLEGLLFGLTPLDPPTFIAVSVLFTVIATIASWVPARRATKVDPLIALRHE